MKNRKYIRLTKGQLDFLNFVMDNYRETIPVHSYDVVVNVLEDMKHGKTFLGTRRKHILNELREQYLFAFILNKLKETYEN